MLSAIIPQGMILPVDILPADANADAAAPGFSGAAFLEFMAATAVGAPAPQAAPADAGKDADIEDVDVEAADGMQVPEDDGDTEMAAEATLLEGDVADDSFETGLKGGAFAIHAMLPDSRPLVAITAPLQIPAQIPPDADDSLLAPPLAEQADAPAAMPLASNATGWLSSAGKPQPGRLPPAMPTAEPLPAAGASPTVEMSPTVEAAKPDLDTPHPRAANASPDAMQSPRDPAASRPTTYPRHHATLHRQADIPIDYPEPASPSGSKPAPAPLHQNLSPRLTSTDSANIGQNDTSLRPATAEPRLTSPAHTERHPFPHGESPVFATPQTSEDRRTPPPATLSNRRTIRDIPLVAPPDEADLPSRPTAQPQGTPSATISTASLPTPLRPDAPTPRWSSLDARAAIAGVEDAPADSVRDAARMTAGDRAIDPDPALPAPTAQATRSDTGYAIPTSTRTPDRDNPAPRADSPLPAATMRPAAPLAVPPELHAQVRIEGDTAHVRVRPRELGDVSITLHRTNGELAIHVHANRPETADNLRRNAALLDQQLREGGTENTHLSFSSGQDPGRGSARQGALPDSRPARHLAEGAATTETDVAAPAAPGRTVTPGRLNLVL